MIREICLETNLKLFDEIGSKVNAVKFMSDRRDRIYRRVFDVLSLVLKAQMKDSEDDTCK